MAHGLAFGQIEAMLVDMTDTLRASDRVAEQIKVARLKRGWSAKDLAVACAELGAPEITAAVVANIETGRRGPDGARRRDVSVDELLIFAYVLAVPPASLLSANDDENDAITMTSSLELAANDVVAWLQSSSGIPIPSPIADGLARCGTCGSAIRTGQRDGSVVYYCANKDCENPVSRLAVNIDALFRGMAVAWLAEVAKQTGVRAPSRDEWDLFPSRSRDG